MMKYYWNEIGMVEWLYMVNQSVLIPAYIYWCVIINPWLVSLQARRALGSRRPHSNCVYRTECIDSKCIDPCLHILVCHYQSLVSLFIGPKGLREPKATLELRVSNRSVLILAYIYWCVLPCWTDSSTSSSVSISKSRNWAMPVIISSFYHSVSFFCHLMLSNLIPMP